jgi:hypothetical protein
MSRSFKKTAGWCDRNPFAKKEANSRVRKTPDLPSGSAYKKVFESWDIHDYKCLLFKAKTKKMVEANLNIKSYKTRMK